MITPIPERQQQAPLTFAARFFSLCTDLEGRCVSSNELFNEKFFPGSAPRYPHRFVESISLQCIETYHAAIEQCIAQQRSISVELQHQAIDAGSITVYWELSLMPATTQILWTGMTLPDRGENKNDPAPTTHNESFFQALFADSLDGVLLVNETGVISFASASVTHVLGFDPVKLIGKNCFDYIHPEDRELGISAFTDELIQSPKQKFIGVRLLQMSGEWLWCMVRGHNLIANPVVGKMLIYFCDDRFRRSAETALLESRERFVHLIQNLNIGIVMCDPEGSILLCNRASVQSFKIPEKEMVGKNVFNNSLKLFNEIGKPLADEENPIARSRQSGNVVRNQIVGVETKENTERLWLEVNAQPVFDDENKIIKHFICSFTDITEKRKLEQQVRLQDQQKQKQLMQATIDGQERERSEISRELHDNISQHLTTTRIYLEFIKDQAEGQFLEMIGQAHKSVAHISHEIRRLSQSLAPPELQDIGLIESIRDLCNLLKKVHAFRITFEHSHFIEASIPDTMKLMLFRIIQEQINNIIRHAGANSLSIDLEADDKEVRLDIADDGKGFDVSQVKKGLGLINIANRVELFDGTAEIISHPGKGCLLRIKAPLKMC